MAALYRTMIHGMQKILPRWAFLGVYGTFATIKNTYNLLIRYGWMKSAYRWKSVDRDGRPIPWFTYPAIEYLDGLDLSACSVLEFGSGFSTLYWSRRSASVLSIEDNVEWADRIQPMLGANAHIERKTSAADYIAPIHDPDAQFDILVIDGIHRLECAKANISRLRQGGLVILDDADDNPEIPVLLRNADFLQVDFAGFSAIVAHTKTTSFFFHREFRPKAHGAHLPLHSICHPKRREQDSRKPE